MVAILLLTNHAQVQTHFAGIVCCDKHLGLFLTFAKRFTPQNSGIARLGKLHQSFDKILLLRRWWNVVQDLILLGTVNANILCCAEVANFGIEGSKLWDLDEGAEALFLDDLVSDGELVVCALLGKDGSPGIKAVDALFLEGLWAQILEEKIEFGQTIGDCRSAEEGCS